MATRRLVVHGLLLVLLVGGLGCTADGEAGPPEGAGGGGAATSGGGGEASGGAGGSAAASAGGTGSGGRAGGGGSAGGLPLGTVTSVTDGVACGGNVPSGAVCSRLVVSCPGVGDAEAIVAITEPSGPVVGTLFTHMGTEGTTFYSKDNDGYLDGGLRIVGVRWEAAWEITEAAGILAAACRPATVLKWAFDGVHQGRRDIGFCGLGFSAGAGALSYALAHYGMEVYLDYVALKSGPPFARIDHGCAPDTYVGPARYLCPEIPDAPLALPPDALNLWDNTQTCGSPSPDPDDLQKWAADSVVSPGADYDHPQTRATFWACGNKPNGTAGGAYLYSREIVSEKAIKCFLGDCHGEDIGTEGHSALAADVLAGCVARH